MFKESVELFILVILLFIGVSGIVELAGTFYAISPMLVTGFAVYKLYKFFKIRL